MSEGMSDEGLRRRAWLVAAGSAMAAGPSAATAHSGRPQRRPPAGPTEADALAAAFGDLTAALNRGDLPAFYDLMHPQMLMIDEDSPWRLDLQGFKDHISFHGGGVWESFAWMPRDIRVRAVGTTGVVAGGATFRGKPKDAGFRLRHLLFSQGWVRDQSVWRMVLWHQAPIVGLVTDGVPA
jgi:hypothetical protein